MESNNDGFVEGILQESTSHMGQEVNEYKDISNLTENLTQDTEKSTGAVWSTSATLTLLKLYESNIEMIETPKKKTKLWVAISENLKKYNIEMTPDQVRWKINALTKKYKQAVDGGHRRFKYFKEMNNIFGQCEVEDEDASEKLQKKKIIRKNNLITFNHESGQARAYESKASIELRKIRLANRIEADRSQSKINLERQWLDFLRRNEEQKQWRGAMFDRNFKLREKELELRRKELEIKEALELKKLNLKEKELEEIIQTERDKLNILSKIVEKRGLQNLQSLH